MFMYLCYNSWNSLYSSALSSRQKFPYSLPSRHWAKHDPLRFRDELQLMSSDQEIFLSCEHTTNCRLCSLVHNLGDLSKKSGTLWRDLAKVSKARGYSCDYNWLQVSVTISRQTKTPNCIPTTFSLNLVGLPFLLQSMLRTVKENWTLQQPWQTMGFQLLEETRFFQTVPMHKTLGYIWMLHNTASVAWKWSKPYLNVIWKTCPWLTCCVLLL